MNTTSNPIQIFRAGTHTAMRGDVLSFSESDLAATAAAYDPSKHEAPLVVGHPRDDAPAYGWVKSLSTNGSTLDASPKQVDPEFAELVKAGRFKKISASFYHPDSPANPVPGVFYLRHVAFLGAQPPAVKGLKAVEFGDGNEGIVEFSEWADTQNASLWRRMREWLIEKFGKDAADQVVPDYAIGTLEAEALRESCKEAPAFSEKNAPHTPPPGKEKVSVTPEEKAALEAENASLKQRLAAAEAEQKAAAAAKRHADHVSYAEELVAQGKLAPKHTSVVAAFLDFAEQDNPVEFGEGDTKTTLPAAFKCFLADLAPVVNFGEVATKHKAGSQGQGLVDVVNYGENVDQDRLAQDQKIRTHMAAHNVDYATAARAVIK